MQRLNLPTYSFNLKSSSGHDWIFDRFRSKWVILTPEEWVRQHIAMYLSQELNYPSTLMSLEKQVSFDGPPVRFDLLIHSRAGEPLMVVECKAPEVPIQQDVFDQVSSYNYRLKAPYALVTNGLRHFCWGVDFDGGSFRFLDGIPDYEALSEGSVLIS